MRKNKMTDICKTFPFTETNDSDTEMVHIPMDVMKETMAKYSSTVRELVDMVHTTDNLLTTARMEGASKDAEIQTLREELVVSDEVNEKVRIRRQKAEDEFYQDYCNGGVVIYVPRGTGPEAITKWLAEVKERQRKRNR
jgi:hypothetical protein